jgi:hypothetical protein
MYVLLISCMVYGNQSNRQDYFMEWSVDLKTSLTLSGHIGTIIPKTLVWSLYNFTLPNLSNIYVVCTSGENLNTNRRVGGNLLL